MEDKQQEQQEVQEGEELQAKEFGELTKKVDSSKAEEEPKEETPQENKELETLKNQYLRLAADFDNYRKRQEQERVELLKYGAITTLEKLLPVLDNLERAKKAVKDIDDAQKVKENFEVVEKQLLEVFEKIGLNKIKTEGEQFNPEFHEAVMQTPSNDHDDHSIIAELQAGYRFEDKVIRAAMVNVATKEE